jgi:hypothetical protein
VEGQETIEPSRPDEQVSELQAPSITASYPAKKDADARAKIALILVAAYVVLLLANIAVPIWLTRIDPAPGSEVVAAVKDLSGPLAAGVTSLTGVLGFVLGYYFKAEEVKRE